MGFKFSEDTKKSLSETFNIVKDKTWTSQTGDFQISTMKEFSKALGQCMAEAVHDENSKLSFALSTDDELAIAASKIMKAKFGV